MRIPNGILSVLRTLGTGVLVLVGLTVYGPTWAAVLEDVSYTSLGANQLEIALRLSDTAPEPGSFTTDNPARIAVDLPGTSLGLDKKTYELGGGSVRNLRALEANGRTRVVISMTHLMPYEVRREGNFVYVDIGRAAVAQPNGQVRAAGAPARTKEIHDIDFRRGKEGEGRVIVAVDPNTVVDMRESGDNLIVDFIGASLPDTLKRRLNVVDFATPVTQVDAFETDSGARLVLETHGNWEHLAYQTADTYTLEVKPVVITETAPQAGSGGDYTGEKLSLNFQNIEVRAVLQLIADFTGLNIVASDTVQGGITLRLKNVPWDQAMDIILKTKGLGMRQTGNVVLVAPNDELAAREKQELEARQQLEELVPLRTAFFQINYAKAEEIAGLLKSEDNSMLSERGHLTIDGRTNTLMVLDTAEKIEAIGKLIERLDVAIRQVLIESRIVIANDDFSRSLGIRTGVTAADVTNDGVTAVSGSAQGTSDMVDSFNGSSVSVPALSDRLNVNLPIAGSAGRIALAVLGGDYLVDLELSALQQENRGEVVSSPRVITSDQQEAVIKQGVEIPYLEASASGATSVSFKEAVLSLNVTPQITPDDRIIMDLRVNKDSLGEVFNGIPTINTRSVQTQVLVDNGDTVVLGGVYEQTRLDGVDKVPFLGDLPILGALFRQTTKQDDKAELLIFVTPKILKAGLNVSME